MQCPDPLPKDFVTHVQRIANALANAKWRKSPSKAMVKQWDEFIRDWSTNKRRPLLIRRAKAGRGSIIIHESGRKLIPTDNSPAHWVYRSAIEAVKPPRRLVVQDIPIAFVMSAVEKEKAEYKKIDSSVRLGNDGWNLCHIDGVNLGKGTPATFPIEELQSHFLRFLSPSNMFLSPKALKGLGEIDHVIDAIRSMR